MKMELTEGSETSAYINQTPGNYSKGNLLNYHYTLRNISEGNIFKKHLCAISLGTFCKLFLKFKVLFPELHAVKHGRN